MRVYRRPRFEFYYSPGYHTRGPLHHRSYYQGYVPHRRGYAHYDYDRSWGGPVYYDRDDWDDFEDRREDYEDWLEDRREDYEDRMEELRERREERWEDWRDRFDD